MHIYLFTFLNYADLMMTYHLYITHGKCPGKSLRKLCLEKSWKPVVACVVMLFTLRKTVASQSVTSWPTISAHVVSCNTS